MISPHCGSLYTASSGHGRSPGGWGQRGTCEMQDIPAVTAVALPPVTMTQTMLR